MLLMLVMNIGVVVVVLRRGDWFRFHVQVAIIAIVNATVPSTGTTTIADDTIAIDTAATTIAIATRVIRTVVYR